MAKLAKIISMTVDGVSIPAHGFMFPPFIRRTILTQTERRRLYRAKTLKQKSRMTRKTRKKVR